MYSTLIGITIASFVTMLFLNLYFRIKVFKYYKKLIDNRVEFNVKDLLNMEKIKSEVVPKYPHMEETILAFVKHIRLSVIMAFILLILISISWSILQSFS